MFGEKWISEARAADATEMVRKESDVRLMRLSSKAQLALLAAVCLIVPGCEDDDAPTGPTPVTGGATPVASGATQVRGTERLAWSQNGDTSRLLFRAYVDNRLVELASVTCDSGSPTAECSCPLPTLSDGVHTIELVTVSGGTESERSAPVTLQKIAAAASASAAPLSWSQSGRRLDSFIRIGDGLEFTMDIVATGVQAPAQMAALPDGRLLVSDANGRVRMVDPGEPDRGEWALEAGFLSTTSIGPLAIASHPDFAQNRFVYVSLLERDRSNETRVRVLRLREVGSTLGEAATLFETSVAATGTAPGEPTEISDAAFAGLRMAFGPDRLLYVMLPPGLEFLNEPVASTPIASMLRLTDAGRAPAAEPLTGITASPLAFAWHQTTGALWVMFRSETGDTALRSLENRARAMSADSARIRMREGAGESAGTLLVALAPDELRTARAFVGTRPDGSNGIARLALPVQAAGRMSDRLGDVVVGHGGTLFVATSNGLQPGVASDVVMRLTPVLSAAAR